MCTVENDRYQSFVEELPLKKYHGKKTPQNYEWNICKVFRKLKQYINLWHISEYPKPLLPLFRTKHMVIHFIKAIATVFQNKQNICFYNCETANFY